MFNLLDVLVQFLESFSISLRAVSSFANPAINPNNVSVVSHYDC